MMHFKFRRPRHFIPNGKKEYPDPVFLKEGMSVSFLNSAPGFYMEVRELTFHLFLLNQSIEVNPFGLRWDGERIEKGMKSHHGRRFPGRKHRGNIQKVG
jgi:hypothetical protein